MAGWPWPLSEVQPWFEDLWNWIGTAATTAVSVVSSWINGAATWIRDRVSEFVSWIVDRVKDFIDGIGAAVTGVADWITSGAVKVISELSAKVWEVGRWIYDQIADAFSEAARTVSNLADTLSSTIRSLIDQITSTVASGASVITSSIWGWVDGALRWASDAFKWLSDRVSETGSFVVDQVGRAFDGASTAIGDVIGSVFRDPLGAVTGFFGTLSNMLDTIGFESHLADMKSLFQSVGDSMATLLAAHSPLTPEEARESTDGWKKYQRDIWYQIYLAALAIEGLSIGQVDATPQELFSEPQTKASFDLATEWYAAPFKIGYGTRLQQYWLKQYQPMIPPAPDIIRMVVREAFVPEMVIEAPTEFASSMEYAGFNKTWSDRYWTAHFEPIALSQAYENLWRGYWDKDKFMYALHIADVHPMWREDIFNVAFRPMSRLEIRHGYEVGVVSREKMIENFRMTGLSLDNAEIAADASIEYAMHEERMGVLTEWRADFEAGFLDEATLRANMSSIGIIADRQDYYVARSTIRRERQRMKDLLDLYKDGFMKDLITEEDLRDRAGELIVMPEVADLYVEKAHVDKYKTPKPPTETVEDKAVKELNRYKISYAVQAYRRYAIEKDRLIEMLVEADVAGDVAAARADYEELKRPVPKPTPIEIAGAKEQARLQTLEVSRAVEEYRRYALTDEELLRRLKDIGLSEALATATMQLEKIRRPSPPIPPEEIERRRLEGSVMRYRGLLYVVQFGDYSITKEELIAALIEAGFDPAEASARADYEEARRPVPKPSAEELERRREERRIRTLAESEALTLFRAGVISSEELVNRLRALAYSEDLVNAIVRYEEIKLTLKKAG